VYEILFSKQADKTLRKMSRNMATLIREKLDQLALDPYAKHNNATKLKNLPAYRLRMGDWRVIYEINDDKLIILVLKIGPRGGIYE
jgi:mRNA interferase RelE/StbE